MLLPKQADRVAQATAILLFQVGLAHAKEERRQLFLRQHGDSALLNAMYATHTLLIELIQEAAAFTADVDRAYRTEDQLEDRAYMLARQKSGTPQAYPSKRPSSRVVISVRDAIAILNKDSQEWASTACVDTTSEIRYQLLSTISSLVESGAYPDGSLPCRHASAEFDGNDNIVVTRSFAGYEDCDPDETPAAYRELADFIRFFHNSLRSIELMVEQFSLRSAFAAVSSRPRRIKGRGGFSPSFHAAWHECLVTTFTHCIAEYLDTRGIYFDLTRLRFSERPPLTIQETLDALVVHIDDERGEDWYVSSLATLYRNWFFPYSRRRNPRGLGQVYANLEHEFLRAVEDIKRRPNAIDSPTASTTVNAKKLSLQEDGPEIGGHFWFGGKKAVLSDVPWRLLNALYRSRNWVLPVSYLEMEVWGDTQEDTALKSAIFAANRALTAASIPLLISKVRNQNVVRLIRNDLESKSV